MIRRRLGELLLVLGSLFAVAFLAGVAELAVRVFSSVDLVGNSRNLFVAGAWGKSHGNAPNVEAISFGGTVYTDEHGFRIPKRGVREDADKREAILILGDSVGFGPAVDEEQTIAGLLRASFPAQRIYNSSVIGYSTPDYRNVVDTFVPRHSEVSAVVLVYCLNDVSAISARNIERHVGRKSESAPASTLTERLRRFTWISDANDYLRSRSKLYLFVRHHLLGTQTRDWKEALGLYSEDGTAEVEQAAGDIAAIAAFLKPRGIPLVVVLAPFEYQLRNPADPDSQVPQRKLADLLERAGVDPIDPRPAFDASRASSDYYLAYDAMHFSAAGHRVMADVITEALRAPRPTAK
jgi:lysophospholipase L1-like esterase